MVSFARLPKMGSSNGKNIDGQLRGSHRKASDSWFEEQNPTIRNPQLNITKSKSIKSSGRWLRSQAFSPHSPNTFGSRSHLQFEKNKLETQPRKTCNKCNKLVNLSNEME